jgi:hypothetical protein
MKIVGCRIHIAGSAKTDAPREELLYAHELIALLTERLAEAGASFVIQFGKEPRSGSGGDDLTQPAIIFDWTVAETLGQLIESTRIQPSTENGPLIACITTEKTERQIPPDRMALWDRLISFGAVLPQHLSGWSSGAVRRQMQAPLGDVLICLSGGEGVEHSATQYALQSKPVIPLDLQLGASCYDGRGGAAMLFEKMRAHPERFVRLDTPDLAGGFLAQMQTRGGSRPAAQVVNAIFKLLDALAPPTVFYVRMLNRDLADFPDVEQYFREVVDPVVRSRGYEPCEMGAMENTSAWMNPQIFESIRQATLTIIDLTALRPNCLIELGYAYGLGKRALLTARKDTVNPFDIAPIETRSWNLVDGRDKLIVELEDYWRRNINRSPLALPPSLL